MALLAGDVVDQSQTFQILLSTAFGTISEIRANGTVVYNPVSKPSPSSPPAGAGQAIVMAVDITNTGASGIVFANVGAGQIGEDLTVTESVFGQRQATGSAVANGVKTTFTFTSFNMPAFNISVLVRGGHH